MNMNSRSVRTYILSTHTAATDPNPTTNPHTGTAILTITDTTVSTIIKQLTRSVTIPETAREASTPETITQNVAACVWNALVIVCDSSDCVILTVHI